MDTCSAAEVGGSFCVFLYGCSLAPAEIPFHILLLKKIFGSTKIFIMICQATAEIWHLMFPMNLSFLFPPQCHYPSQFTLLGLHRGIRRSEFSHSYPVSFLASLSVIHETLDKTNPFFVNASRETMFPSSPF